MGDADGKVKDMCAALADDDFEKAAGLMHPSVGMTADSLRDSISDIEKKCGIDFSNGVEFVGINIGSHPFAWGGSYLYTP